MEEIIIRADDTDPQSVAVYQSAVGAYNDWCRAHGLATALVRMVRVRADAKEFDVCDSHGGTIWTSQADALRPALKAKGFL